MSLTVSAREHRGDLMGLEHIYYSEAGGLGINRIEPVREVWSLPNRLMPTSPL